MTAKRFQFLFVQSIKNVLSGHGVVVLLSAFGALWMVVEITDYFAKDSLAIVWVHNISVFFSCWDLASPFGNADHR